VDVVDIVLLVVVIVAGVQGLRLGALIQIFTYVGFWLGITLGVLAVVVLAPGIHNLAVRTFVTLLVVFGLAFLAAATGRVLGGWSNAALRRHHLGRVDSVLGVAVAVVAVLVSAWLVASFLSESRYNWLSSSIQRSDILRAVDEVLPPAPSVFAHVQSFLGTAGFPPVFVELAPPVSSPVPVMAQSEARLLGELAANSTVKVVGQACGYLQEGSGFAVGHDEVVTNAHVVAGESHTDVSVDGVLYPATPVFFDPSFDLAVLRTRAPLGAPLRLAPSEVSRGTRAAVLGYPENGPLTIGPAGVASVITAEGRDIYNSGLVVRDVYEIDADIRPGNSGGPAIAPNGEVIGVVFSRSTVDAGVGYALTSPGVLDRVQRAAGLSAPVGTGGCTQG